MRGIRTEPKAGTVGTENFQDAAVRHHHDARRLAAGERFQNAGYLIGLAAECLVKGMLEKDGNTIERGSGFRCHFPELARVIGQYVGEGPYMRLLAPIVVGSEFLSGWDVNTRYAGELEPAVAKGQFMAWQSDVSQLFLAVGLP